MTKKQMLRYIDNNYDAIDLMTMEALASCAIEGNPMMRKVSRVLWGWIWNAEKHKQEPSLEDVESVYKLIKWLKETKNVVPKGAN